MCLVTSVVSDNNPEAPLSMGFSWQEYWSEWPCSPPGDLPNPGIKYVSPALQASSLLSKPLEKADKSYIL